MIVSSTLYIIWHMHLQKFEAATPSGLGKDAFTKKYIIISYTNCYPVPSTSMLTALVKGGDAFARKYIL